MANNKRHTQTEVPGVGERAQTLLKTLVECYIREGQPVGSRALARESGLDLSPATIRNVMADLEDLGLVASPHTSAGRIPTAKGYRLFVDSLIKVKPLNELSLEDLQLELAQGESMNKMLGSVSTFLSKITRMAGLVMIPRRDYRTLRRIEFLPLSERKVLAILVISETEVQNRIIETKRKYSHSELTETANYLNEWMSGTDLIQLRERLLQEMRQTKDRLNSIMQTAIEMAGQVFDSHPETSDYVLSGETNLMEFHELSDVEKLRALFEAFNEKRDILHLLDQCLTAHGVQIFIGEESGYKVLGECSVITSPYEVEGEVLGVLGVIGPTRMAYERVIPIVDVTAKMLGAALNNRS